MTAPIILEASVSGQEVEDIIAQRLIPAIADLERSKVMLSLLTFFVVLMKPDLSTEVLVDTVKQTSQFVCLMLSEQQGADTGSVPENEMN